MGSIYKYIYRKSFDMGVYMGLHIYSSFEIFPSSNEL